MSLAREIYAAKAGARLRRFARRAEEIFMALRLALGFAAPLEGQEKFIFSSIFPHKVGLIFPLVRGPRFLSVG